MTLTEQQATNGAAARAAGPAASQFVPDFVHTGPETLAGRYLRGFWQPVHRAQDLVAGWAKPIRVMSEDFTLYRGEGGTPHVVAFRCAHRGTQLSTGWVEGNCIRCFYHGWKYDETGQCVEMPAEDPSFPPKVQIRSYPTQEYLRLIFAYLGEGPAPPFPRYPDFEDDGIAEVATYTRACNYFNNVENSADEAHVSFVHRDTHGLPEVPQVHAEETSYGLVYYSTRGSEAVRYSYIQMPNILRVSVPVEAELWREHIAWRVPLDDERHCNFGVSLLRLTGEEARAFAARRGARPKPAATVEALAERVLRGELHTDDVLDHPAIINLQDIVAQVGQGAIADREHERLGRSDVAIILLRQLWTRELRALAAGQPLTRWHHPDRLPTTSGV